MTQTETTTTRLSSGGGGMPPCEQMAVQAVKHLVADGYVSSVMKLEKPLLNELARRLVDAGETVNDAAIDWLKEQGVNIAPTNVYRFAQRFREVYDDVVADWAGKLIFHELENDPSFSTDDLQRLIKNRTLHLIGQEMISTTDPKAIDTKRLSAVLSSIRIADQRAVDAEKLALARDASELRATKLESDLKKTELQLQQIQQKLDQAAAKFEAEIRRTVETRQGGAITDEDISTARKSIFGF